MRTEGDCILATTLTKVRAAVEALNALDLVNLIGDVPAAGAMLRTNEATVALARLQTDLEAAVEERMSESRRAALPKLPKYRPFA